ncbi:MAG: hypothetical protein ACOCRO_05635 [Halanaerobiales bacterium]
MEGNYQRIYNNLSEDYVPGESLDENNLRSVIRVSRLDVSVGTNYEEIIEGLKERKLLVEDNNLYKLVSVETARENLGHEPFDPDFTLRRLWRKAEEKNRFDLVG